MQFSMAKEEGPGSPAGSSPNPRGTANNVRTAFRARAPLDQQFGNGEPPGILVIDGNEMSRRFTKATLKNDAYRIRECRTPSEAMEVLQNENVDVIVLDLMLPEMSGPEFCHWLKSNRKTQFIPTLMLTSIKGIENEITGLSSGAEEYLIKPVLPTVLRARIRVMLRLKALIDSLEEAETILFSVAIAVERRDKNTGLHCERLASYSVMMGEALGLSPLELTALYRGGFLHDIGKISVPDEILFKKGKLTASEWDVMRKHTLQGEDICRPMKSLATVLPIIRNHHEKWDGTGYPDGLKAEEIPLLARILQVVDIYDALTTARPYKRALSPEEALDIMRQEVEKGWRDPVLTKLFIDRLEQGPEKDICAMEASLNNMQVGLSDTASE